MRILHVTERFGSAGAVGGAQQSVASLCSSLSEQGHQVAVIYTSDDERTAQTSEGLLKWPLRLPRSSKALRQPTLPRFLSAAYFMYEGYLQTADESVKKVIDDFKPHVINTHILTGISDHIWKVATAQKVPVVHSVRDYYLLCARSTMYKPDTGPCGTPCFECQVVTRRRRRLSRLVHGFVGISHRVLELHRRAGLLSVSQPSAVIHNSVEPPTVVDTYREAPGTFTLGFLGRLVPSKGLEQLIGAFKAANLPDGVLKIAGDGAPDYVNRLRGEASSANILFVGRVDSAPFINSCSAIAVPSMWEEPFGRVVAEALVSATPVICSDSGAFPELLAEFPGGILTTPANREQFARDIRRMNKEGAALAEFLQNNLPTIRSHFSGERVSQRYADFYRQIIDAITRRSAERSMYVGA